MFSNLSLEEFEMVSHSVLIAKVVRYGLGKWTVKEV